MTGCGPIASASTDFSTTCNAYNTTLGMTASTTGNITGVYDMHGGASEYVMGNMSSASGNYTFYPGGSWFESNWYSVNTAKYLATYAYGTSNRDQTAYNRGRLGDATGEVVLGTGSAGGWYNSYANFPYSNESNFLWTAWFVRSGFFEQGTDYGTFFFASDNGGAYDNFSSRAALIGLS